MNLVQLGWALVLSAVAAPLLQAAPILSVTPRSLNASGNREWLVEVAPDANLFSGNPPSGALAVELAFAIDSTELLGIDINTTAWSFENPGNNPFTGTVTDGAWVDLIGDRTFGAFGSVLFTSAEPVRLFTIETQGGGLSTVRYGVAAAGHASHGSTIAQAGQNFTGYTGAVTIPEPLAATSAMIGLAALAVGPFRRRAARRNPAPTRARTPSQ